VSRARIVGLLAAVAAGGLGVAAESSLYGLGDPGHWVPDAIAGWALIGGGLVASRRPRARWCAALLALAGVLWFAGNFDVSPPLLYLYVGALVQLALTYPIGRPRGRATTAAVAAGWTTALVPAVWQSPWATIGVAAALVAVAGALSLGARGRERRLRFAAWQAAAGLGGILMLVAAFHLAGARSAALLLEQVTLVGYAVALVAGLFAEPWRQDPVADLVVTLGERRSLPLRTQLARVLGDPGLEIGFWDARAGRFVDAVGREIDVDSPSSRAVTRLERDGRPVAVILYTPGTLDDPTLESAVEVATELGSAYARLQAEVREQLRELVASRRRLVGAADAERERLGRSLRQGAEARLRALAAALSAAREQAAQPAVVERIAVAEERLAETLADLHRLALGLRPRALDEGGLAAGLASLAAASPVPVRLTAPPGRLATEVESTLYFVCAEALANAAKHAAAAAIEVSLAIEGGIARLEVADDGIGGAEPRGIADRVEAVGGTLRVVSPAGAGTRLVVEIPTEVARSEGRAGATPPRT
jgi:signal transduction histidine kinase